MVARTLLAHRHLISICCPGFDELGGTSCWSIPATEASSSNGKVPTRVLERTSNAGAKPWQRVTRSHGKLGERPVVSGLSLPAATVDVECLSMLAGSVGKVSGRGSE